MTKAATTICVCAGQGASESTEMAGGEAVERGQFEDKALWQCFLIVKLDQIDVITLSCWK